MVVVMGRKHATAEATSDGLDAGISEEEYLTIREAASCLSISEPMLRMTIRLGRTPARWERGRRPLVKRTDLQGFVKPFEEESPPKE